MSTKYKLTDNILDTKGAIKKLESDGFSREQIHKQMYALTPNMPTQERAKLMQKMYYRGDK